MALLPERAIINDYNEELIQVYEVIRDDVDGLLEKLSDHEAHHSEDYFYQVRQMDREAGYGSLSSLEKAARFLYLNKTCYNGLYRVNAKGEFNVPFGKYKHPNIMNAETLRAVSSYFREKEVTMYHQDFSAVMDMAQPGDFVYLDPPYMPLSVTSSFTSYTQKGFSYEEQVRLKEACDKLRERGIPFLQSNSDCEAIRELYADYEIQTVQAARSINSQGSKRGKINEVLISYGI